MAMERTRIAKVDHVTLSRRGEQVQGTLHLTPHHLIFVHIPSTTTQPLQSDQSSPAQPPSKSLRPRELWIPYPVLSLCTLRPSHPASRQPSSIRLRCRDFSFTCFYFSDLNKARDVYDSIRAWTCKIGRIEKLYAFTYQPQGPEREFLNSTGNGGWSIYDPYKEWARMGIGVAAGMTAGSSGRTSISNLNSNWRVSHINVDHGFSPTYPSLFAVPSSISDITLNHAGRYRSRARIPVLTYLHPVNNCSITRCSQPLVGVRQNRSIQDETLLNAIFSTTRNERPLENFGSSLGPSNPPSTERGDSTLSDTTALSESTASSAATSAGDLQQNSAEALEDAVISKFRGDKDQLEEAIEDKKPIVYGAQQKNMIVDARPTVNAYAMQAVGMGTENMDNYKFATKAYLGIDNIHVMRDSLAKVVDALKDSDISPLGPSREQLAKSGWLKHIANMLDGVSLIVRQVGLQHSHVLIHCSDGWDRTSQLSALSQLCLDPYYRTIEGFIVLVEKDWVSFGHMFRHRTGFLSSEKWFISENERIIPRDDEGDGKRRDDVMTGAQKTFENAFLSAKGFFTKQHNDSRESVNVDSEAETAVESETKKGNSPAPKTEKDPGTKVKETAPIFHQFLDATYQLMQQHPTRFEFSERFLRRLLYHLYSCQYGTFLYDNEKERKEAKISERARSVWDYFLARKKEFLNPEYDSEVDDNARGKERLIFPRSQDVKWWFALFGRTDEEMNGPMKSSLTTNADFDIDMSSSQGGDSRMASMPVSRSRTPVLTGVETSEASIGVARLNLSRQSDHKLELSKEPIVRNPGSDQEEEAATNPSAPPIPGDSSCIETSRTSQVEEAAVDGADKHARKLDSASEQLHVQGKTYEEPLPHVDDGIDPLGIGEVKDHVPIDKKAALEKRRAQMELLMQ